MASAVIKKQKKTAVINGESDGVQGMAAHRVSTEVIRLREGVMLFLGLVAGYLLISLYSYSPDDPMHSITLLSPVIENDGGRLGAFLAQRMYAVLGYMAWLIPAVVLLQGYWVFQYRYQVWHWLTWSTFFRITGFAVSVVCGAGLLSMHYRVSVDVLPNTSGGAVGSYMSHLFLPIFNTLGSTLVLTVVFFIGLTLSAAFSWFWVFDRLGGGGRLLWSSLLLKMRVVYRYCHKNEQSLIRRVSTLHWLKRWRAGQTKSPKKQKQRAASNAAPQTVSVATPTPVAVPATGSFDRGPALSLLDTPEQPVQAISAASSAIISQQLELKLKDFGVEITVTDVHPGPVITRYEIQPAPGIKASRISGLARDLARSLAVVSVRVVEVIPGKSVMGIEIPNEKRAVVYFKELVAAHSFEVSASPLSLALGHDIGGTPVVVDLAKMPHLLVAGTTGSGKSVGVNAMLLSLLFKSGPDQVRLIMVDPKMLELSVYDGIPHLLTPVVTDMKEAANALRWCVAEMERRYKLMATLGVRNIDGFNQKVNEGIASGQPLTDPLYEPLADNDQPPELKPLPYIVVVVDEFADMMMIVGKKVEELIARIAQKARAAGIHLILATQRPSVDVITGLIKANVPTRISFQVSSKIDSRTIIDQGGAEQLLGHGDMLYLPPGNSVPVRVHGAFVSDDEVHRVVADWKQRGRPCYVEAILQSRKEATADSLDADFMGEEEQDLLYDKAVAFVTETRRASISSLQRKLKIGYNRAARMIETMEAAGVITAVAANGKREVIAPPPVNGE